MKTKKLIGLIALLLSLQTLLAQNYDESKCWMANDSLVNARQARDQARNWNTNFLEDKIPEYKLNRIVDCDLQNIRVSAIKSEYNKDSGMIFRLFEFQGKPSKGKLYIDKS